MLEEKATHILNNQTYSLWVGEVNPITFEVQNQSSKQTNIKELQLESMTLNNTSSYIATKARKPL